MPRSDPKNNTFTDADYALLSRIFRLIIQEIRTEEDKEKLAPGELGINYKEGAFYIRNPHNGKLFSPNIAFWPQLDTWGVTVSSPGTMVLMRSTSV